MGQWTEGRAVQVGDTLRGAELSCWDGTAVRPLLQPPALAGVQPSPQQCHSFRGPFQLPRADTGGRGGR